MTRDQFWTTVAAARAEGGFVDRPWRLREVLLRASAAEVASFAEHFYDAMDDAYTWDLWAAACIINGGCSDDGFTDFRQWLISCGRDRYESALADPESLADVAFGPDAEHDASFEEFSVAVASDVFEALTGRPAPARPGAPPREPRGVRWRECDLADRFPRLWKRWGTVRAMRLHSR